jgi:Domain of unknown function (DUF4380)
VTPTESFLGWPALRLDNGTISAVVVPDIGGRVLQFWLGEHACLFVNQNLAGRLFTPAENWGDGTMSSWKNYGGNKTWPAPQGWDGPNQWAGPPDPVLDSGRFEVLVAEPLRVVVQSPPDARTGLQITRAMELELHSARGTLRRTMRNVSDRPVRWSLWDVTQLDCANLDGSARAGCRITIPLNPASRLPGGYAVLYGQADNPQWRRDRAGLLDVEYSGALGKVGLDSQAGWVAFSDTAGDWVFAHQFSVTPEAEYPDGGATVEVWTQGPGVAAGVDFSQPHLRGLFMEMEVLGPLVELAPGESSSMALMWAACRCPGPVSNVTRDACCGRPLQVERRGNGWHVSGAWGVFESARVQLRTRGTSDVLLEQTAKPLQPFVLEHDVEMPDNAQVLEVVLVRNTGETLLLASSNASAT